MHTMYTLCKRLRICTLHTCTHITRCFHIDSPTCCESWRDRKKCTPSTGTSLSLTAPCVHSTQPMYEHVRKQARAHTCTKLIRTYVPTHAHTHACTHTSAQHAPTHTRTHARPHTYVHGTESCNLKPLIYLTRPKMLQLTSTNKQR